MRRRKVGRWEEFSWRAQTRWLGLWWTRSDRRDGLTTHDEEFVEKLLSPVSYVCVEDEPAVVRLQKAWWHHGKSKPTAQTAAVLDLKNDLQMLNSRYLCPLWCHKVNLPVVFGNLTLPSSLFWSRSLPHVKHLCLIVFPWLFSAVLPWRLFK